jgi:DNA repair exonuclease SbcCD nuclease subunit
MGFTVVHTADFHLDRNFSYLPDDKAYIRKADLLNAFYQVVDFTLENKPDVLLICGDTFDKVLPRNPAKVHLIRNIRKIKENGTEIFVIGGNHDVPKGSKEGTMPIEILGAAGLAHIFTENNTEEISYQTLEKDGRRLNIHGLSFNPFFPSDKFITPHVNTPEGYNILMMHGALQGISCVDNEYEDDNPIDASSINKSDLDYVAMGHYHNFGKKEYDGTLACYSGSTEKITFAEENDNKCFLYLQIDDSGVDFEQILLKNREIKTRFLEVNSSIPDIDRTLSEQLKKYANPEQILRIKIRGHLTLDKYKTLHKTKLYSDFINNYFWFTIIDELELGESELIHLDKLEDNPIKVYKSHMERKIQKLEGIEKEKYKKALKVGLNILSEVKEN